jgi:hypothetical protein
MSRQRHEQLASTPAAPGARCRGSVSRRRGVRGYGQIRSHVAVTPSVGLMDQARAIVISHLSPGETIVVSARSLRPRGVWTARATFKADGSGFVDIAGEAPLSGSYRGVSPMGLLWSEHLSGSGSAPLNGVTVTTLTVSAANRRPATARLTRCWKVQASPSTQSESRRPGSSASSSLHPARSAGGLRLSCGEAPKERLATVPARRPSSPRAASPRSRWRTSTSRGCRAACRMSRWNIGWSRSWNSSGLPLARHL